MESIAYDLGYIMGVGMLVGIPLTIVYFVHKKLTGKKIYPTQS